MTDHRDIIGFLADPLENPAGGIYRGRITCPAVQWTGAGEDSVATFTITAGQLADAAANNMLWTDQDVQRGIKPEAQPRPARELSLAQGYPDANKYIFHGENADDMVEKLLRGDRLFLNPLVWNLRPGEFQAYWDDNQQAVYLYEGKIYLPDSHHRQQAIIKAVSLWREARKDYPKFTQDRQFKIELYFLNKENEGNYFFDKNQRPRPTAQSKAYDLTTLDDLSLLAKRVIDHSRALRENVNRVTDRLPSKNPQVVTLSTLREMMRTFASGDDIDTSELEGMATIAARLYDMLAEVRPELAQVTVTQRKEIRAKLIVDAAVMMHGYAALMKDFNADCGRLGIKQAQANWTTRLARLSAGNIFRYQGSWSGDLFDKFNPLWARVGVVKPGRAHGSLTVTNTGATRLICGRVLREVLGVQDDDVAALPLFAERQGV